MMGLTARGSMDAILAKLVYMYSVDVLTQVGTRLGTRRT